MAKWIDKDTNVEAEIEKTQKLTKIFWYTSNKFWRVSVVTLAGYNNMILNNDTLRDKNGLNDKFANLEWAELKAVEKAVKTSDKKDVAKANKIIAKKVSTLDNFMDKYEAGIISDKKTGLIKDILDLLERTTWEVVDNSEELKAKDQEIEKGNDKIAELEAELKEAKKVVPEVKAGAKANDKKDWEEDSPFQD